MKGLLPMLSLCATSALADFPVVQTAQVYQTGTQWRVDVTVSHPDTGWDHYADGWEVLDQDGRSLGFRTLHHPHVHEQPFTRSLTLSLPDGTESLLIRARCSRDGLDEIHTFAVPLR